MSLVSVGPVGRRTLDEDAADAGPSAISSNSGERKLSVLRYLSNDHVLAVGNPHSPRMTPSLRARYSLILVVGCIKIDIRRGLAEE